MRLPDKQAVGVRYAGWAALSRDPQEDYVEFTCPHCGEPALKAAKRPQSEYHFTDGFLQDLLGEVVTCGSCKRPVRVVPVVVLHDKNERRRFEAVFSGDLVSRN